MSERPSQSSSTLKKAAQSFFYEEATGKTVDSIRYADQPGGMPVFEIRFTDGTFLFIEPVLRIQFRLRYLRASRGNIKTIRDYGLVSGHVSSSLK